VPGAFDCNTCGALQMKKSGSVFLIGAALISGDLLLSSLGVAAAVHQDDIFELFIGNKPETGAESFRERQVKIRKQRRATIFDLFDGEQSNKRPANTKKQKRPSEKLVIKPQTKRSAPSAETDLRPRKELSNKQMETKLVSAPLPRSKPAGSASKPSLAVSCEQARDIISKYAFSDVVEKSCSGSTYQFAASRAGKRFLIKISGRNGELMEVKKDTSTSAANDPTPRTQANYRVIPRSLLPVR
jgi:hypothetical protein